MLLPDDVTFEGTGSPLSRCPSYYETTCPQCGNPAKRDTDTMDTFVDSSWYFIRYTDPKCETPFVKETVNRMLPVDVYIGGVEHATLHLMYSRFFVKVLRDLGLLDFNEPFQRLYNHGMVNDSEGRKQSKSLGNVVEPFDVIDVYGADALRVYLMFATAYNVAINWDDTGPKDARAYLNRVWRLCSRLEDALKAHPESVMDKDLCQSGPERELRRITHETIQKVTEDTEGFQFNTAIAALMALTNAHYQYPETAAAQPAAASYRILIRMLGIFAPHICEEIWESIGGGTLLVEQPWPVLERDALEALTQKIAIQVNGKFAVAVEVDRDADEEQILEAALQEKKVQNRLREKSIHKKIYVPNRLLNILVS